MRLFFDFLIPFFIIIGLANIPYLILDLVAYPFIFLVSGEFNSLTQIALKTVLQDGIFPIGSLNLDTDLKGFNIVVNSLIDSSLSVTGRWTLAAIAVGICLGSIVFTARFDIDCFREDKLSKFFQGAGFLLGGIPMIPIAFGGYWGIGLLILEKIFRLF